MIDINVKYAGIPLVFSARDGDREPFWDEYLKLNLSTIEDIPKAIEWGMQYFLHETTDTQKNRFKEAFRYCYTVGDGASLIDGVYLPGIEDLPSLELFTYEFKLFCLRLWHELFKEDLVPADITQYRHRKDETIYYPYLKVQPPPQDWSQAIYTDFPEFKPWWPQVTTVNG